MSVSFRIAAVTALLALGGCATNTLRLDRATTLGVAGGRATAATEALLDKVDAANRATAIDVASLDPACRLPAPLIASAASPGTAAGPEPFICRAGAPRPGDFELRRLDRRAFAPALAVVAALSDYLGVIDAVVSEEPVDAGAVFLDAEAKLSGVAENLASITGSAAPPALTSAQAKAVASALTLVGTLAQEADKVARLKAIERDPAQAARFASTLADLRAVNAMWTTVLANEVGKQADATEIALRPPHADAAPAQPAARGTSRDAAVGPARRPLTATEVHALRERQMDLIDRQAEVAALGPALAKSVDALEAAHRAYRALLFDPDAPKTPAERRRAAKLIETRLLAALNALGSLVRAF